VRRNMRPPPREEGRIIIFAMCDEFLMGCTLVTAFVHLCVLFSGILVHLVATLTGYVDILLNRIVFLESIVR